MSVWSVPGAAVTVPVLYFLLMVRRGEMPAIGWARLVGAGVELALAAAGGGDLLERMEAAAREIVPAGARVFRFTGRAAWRLCSACWPGLA